MKTKLVVFTLFVVSLLVTSYVLSPVKTNPLSQPIANTSETGQEQTPEKQSISHELDFPLKLPENLEIGIFAKGLDSPRDLQFSPSGTLLVSSTQDGTITAFLDSNSDGVSEDSKVILNNLQRPHGLAFLDNYLFVAQENKVSRYVWDEPNLEASVEQKIVDLPKGGRHFTRSLVFDNSGKLYVSIGSSCDVCLEGNEWLASVVVTDQSGNNPQVFAKGLRNAVFLAKNPKTNQIWTTEMGRDFLGDKAPPDEINILSPGGDFGWPLCYGDKTHDKNFDKNTYKQNPCNVSLSPAHQITPHSAPLGLTFVNSAQFPADWQGDLLVAYHGSWNSSVPVGYKVVHLDIEDDRVVGEDDLLSGFLAGTQVRGRPVDLTFDKYGSLYISDDKAGLIYKIVKK